MTQLQCETKRPEFEHYREGIKVLGNLPSPNLAIIGCTSVAVFSMSQWSILPYWMAAIVAVVLMLMALIHSVLVHRGHAKNFNKERDGPPELSLE